MSLNAETTTTTTTTDLNLVGSSSTSSSTNKSSILKHFNAGTFVSGGLAGCIAKTLVAPIDRVKILLQVHSTHYDGYGIFESFYRIYQKEGFKALYKGNGAQMVRIFPYAAMQFTSYETFKSLNKKLFRSRSDHYLNTLVCGSLAGITAVSTTYPLDVIRSRLAFQFKGEHVYTGIFDSIKKIYSENKSIRGFYRGYLITIIGMVPYAGLSFSTFEHIKRFVLNNKFKHLTVESNKTPSNNITTTTTILNTNKINKQSNYYELTVLGKLLCGALTGIIAQTITYPLDVVRRHMQLSTMLQDAATKQ